MFDRLWDLLAKIWETLIPFVLVREYQRGVVLRAGTWHRDVGPGFHWVFPRPSIHWLEVPGCWLAPVRGSRVVRVPWLGLVRPDWATRLRPVGGDYVGPELKLPTITLRAAPLRLPLPAVCWEEAVVDSVVTSVCELPAQPLTTRDEVAVTIQALITSHVVDARKLLLQVEGRDAALQTVAAGVVAQEVLRHTWDELRTPEFADSVFRAVRKRGFRYGIEVDEVAFPGMQRCRSLLLVQPRRTTDGVVGV